MNKLLDLTLRVGEPLVMFAMFVAAWFGGLFQLRPSSNAVKTLALAIVALELIVLVGFAFFLISILTFP